MAWAPLTSGLSVAWALSNRPAARCGGFECGAGVVVSRRRAWTAVVVSGCEAWDQLGETDKTRGVQRELAKDSNCSRNWDSAVGTTGGDGDATGKPGRHPQPPPSAGSPCSRPARARD